MKDKLKIQQLSAVIFGILSVTLVSTASFASVMEGSDVEFLVRQPGMQVGQCYFQPGHGGGDVPSLEVNSHVELAAGEFYSLYGTIVAGSDSATNSTAVNSVPMFAVDLQQHPWLANVRRARAPYYFLTGGWPFWTQFLQKRVLLTAQARIVYTTRPNGDRVSEIALQPMDSGSVTPVSSFWNRTK